MTTRNNRNDESYSSTKQLELDLECPQYEDVVTEAFDEIPKSIQAAIPIQEIVHGQRFRI